MHGQGEERNVNNDAAVDAKLQRSASSKGPQGASVLRQPPGGLTRSNGQTEPPHVKPVPGGPPSSQENAPMQSSAAAVSTAGATNAWRSASRRFIPDGKPIEMIQDEKRRRGPRQRHQFCRCSLRFCQRRVKELHQPQTQRSQGSEWRKDAEHDAVGPLRDGGTQEPGNPSPAESTEGPRGPPRGPPTTRPLPLFCGWATQASARLRRRRLANSGWQGAPGGPPSIEFACCTVCLCSGCCRGEPSTGREAESHLPEGAMA
ncbi:hypothetical protein cyc_07924 [Cyclospora cayetanensis]|uniref:Uncharacterized protein n=1 Tax=Cyclospora cayetanensis TaxID=88456 RepID=A0A1D3CVW2_9EIME|nr:hypothetical protein cyc_07924 [Cyclospora cayetanensis]